MITLKERWDLRTKAEFHAGVATGLLSELLNKNGRVHVSDSDAVMMATIANAHAQASLAYSALAEQGNW